jgi:prepilin-type N-terminal cleavage/methylation domain-containing protein
MLTRLAMQKAKERGFTLMEVLVATLVLFTGIIAVAQIVPVALTANSGNRRDSSAAVIAQRVLAQFVQLPVTSPNPFIDTVPNSPCSLGCNLGDPTQPGVTVGNPVVIIGNRPAINFGAAAVAGYSFTTVADPEDPSGATYDVRWAVITSGNGATASSRRFILGARQTNATTFMLPLTLDAMVQR